jgi:hypothetical protein
MCTGRMNLPTSCVWHNNERIVGQQMNYLDFDLSFRRDDDQYRAVVVRSPGGEAQAVFSLPTEDKEYRKLFFEDGLPRRGVQGLAVPDAEIAKAFGTKLFNTIFRDDVGACLRVSLGQAKVSRAGLRIRLRMNETPELADLPWEFLYNSQIGSFLSLKADTPLVRYLEIPELISALRVDLPLKLLVVSSSPKDKLQLDVADEFERLLDATSGVRASGSLTIDTLPHASLKSLQNRLQESAVHILHFIGHGDFKESTQESVLFFEDESGNSREISGEFLAAVLGNHPSLRVVVLNACHGARSSLKDPFAGVSQALLRRGLPAAIAMQFAITDKAARVFAEAFYEAIANRYAVDAALVEARTALYVDGQGAEWGTPVLFMRAPDGRVFDIATPTKKASRWILAGLLLLAAASGLLFWRFMHPSLKVPRVAVVGPVNASNLDRFNYVSTAIGDLVSLNLSSSGGTNPVPREEIAQVLQDIQISPDVCSLKERSTLLNRALGASYLISGQLTKPNDPNRTNEVHVSLCLENSDGKTLDEWDGYVNDEGVQAAAAIAAEKFRKSLGPNPPPAQNFDATFPQDVNARRLYFEGVADLRSFGARAAQETLEKAREIEDTSPQIHWALSNAWSMLRQDPPAANEAKRALELLQAKPDYSLEFGLLLKAQAEESSHQWDLAAADYSQLYGANQERLDYGLKLANAQVRGSHINEALKTIKRLKALGTPLGNDPRILIAESRVYQAQPDYRMAAEAAERARDMSAGPGERITKANALLELCWTHIKLGQEQGLRDTCNDAKETFSVMGDKVSAAVALNEEANWLGEQELYKEAKERLKEVIEINEKYGAQSDLAGALINSANMSLQQNRRAEAGPLLNNALEILCKMNEKPDQAATLVNLAEVSREEGDISTSMKQANQALNIAREIQNSSLEALALSALAQGESEIGKLADALTTYQKVIEIRQNLGERSKIATTKERIADVHLRTADLPRAANEGSAALQIYTELGKSNEGAQALVLLAEIALNNGSLTVAEAGVRNAIGTFQKEQDEPSEKDATALLIRVLVAQGKEKLPETEHLVEKMKTLAKPDPISGIDSDPDVELDADLAEGIFLTAIGNASSAYEILNTASIKAHGWGRIFLEHELWLAKIEALRRSGKNELAKDELAKLTKSANELGFKIISDRAAKL